jgi:hypothetical protein
MKIRMLTIERCVSKEGIEKYLKRGDVTQEECPQWEGDL